MTPAHFSFCPNSMAQGPHVWTTHSHTLIGIYKWAGWQRKNTHSCNYVMSTWIPPGILIWLHFGNNLCEFCFTLPGYHKAEYEDVATILLSVQSAEKRQSVPVSNVDTRMVNYTFIGLNDLYHRPCWVPWCGSWCNSTTELIRVIPSSPHGVLLQQKEVSLSCMWSSTTCLAGLHHAASLQISLGYIVRSSITGLLRCHGQWPFV